MADATYRRGEGGRRERTIPVWGSMGDAATKTTFMIDSGASSEFVDTAFAKRCGWKIEPSICTIRLADGTVVPAEGKVTLSYMLATSGKAAARFTSTFTLTPLLGYDAILGMSWLTIHDVLAGFKNRTITVRTVGQPPIHIKPIVLASDEVTVAKLASITMGGLAKAHQQSQVEDLYFVTVTPLDDKADEKADEKKIVEPPKAEVVHPPLLAALLKEYADVSPDKLPDGLPPTRGIQHRIDLVPDARIPAVRPLHHQSTKDLALFQEYTESMVASGQIRPSTSPYGAMALIVRKKDGTARVVIDYRGLNDITVKNKYPLPLMDELLDRVVNAKVFSKLDLRTGFHQIRVHEEDVAKTAFRTRYGSFEYRVLPMGLCNAPGTFMQLMNDTFRHLLDKCVLVFLDDILVYSDTMDDHYDHLRQVLETLRKAKLYAKMSKCEFAQKDVEFLGHHIGADGLAVMQDKVKAVEEWPVPRDVSDVRSFLGLTGFYRKFVKAYSKVALPMSNLTKTVTGSKFHWDAAEQAAFVALKKALCSAPVLLIADPKANILERYRSEAERMCMHHSMHSMHLFKHLFSHL